VSPSKIRDAKRSVCLFFVFLAGCGAPAPPPSGPTFRNVEAQVLSGCSCHGEGSSSGSLDLSLEKAYQQLVGVPAAIAPQKLRVKPGDPDHSFLYQKLTGMLPTDGSEGVPMPELRAAPVHYSTTTESLPDDDLTLVHDWIAAGALDD
jgi:hypothetical protein